MLSIAVGGHDLAWNFSSCNPIFLEHRNQNLKYYGRVLSLQREESYSERSAKKSTGESERRKVSSGEGPKHVKPYEPADSKNKSSERKKREPPHFRNRKRNNPDTSMESMEKGWNSMEENSPWGDFSGEVIGDGGFVLDPWIEAMKLGNPRYLEEQDRKTKFKYAGVQPDPPPPEGNLFGPPTPVPAQRRNSVEEMRRKEFVYGPHGPYAYRTGTHGKPRAPRLNQACVAYMSTVKDDREQEEINQYIMTMDYEKKVETMDDMNIGVKHFFAFARKVGGKVAPEDPWEDWTLVAQIAVESLEDPDKWALPLFLSADVKSKLAQCVGWYRPDLIYVKKPAFQVRFEPQPVFYGPLLQLLLPHGAVHENGTSGSSFYSKIKRILSAGASADRKRVLEMYTTASDKVRSLLWKHVFESVPESPLHPFRPPKSWNADPFINDPRVEGSSAYRRKDKTCRNVKEAHNAGTTNDIPRNEGDGNEGTLCGEWERAGDGVWWNEIAQTTNNRESASRNEPSASFEELSEDAEISDRVAKDGLSNWVVEDNKDVEEWKKLANQYTGNVECPDDGKAVSYTVNQLENDQTASGEFDSAIKQGRVPILKAAVCPFNYMRLLSEITFLREALEQTSYNGL